MKPENIGKYWNVLEILELEYQKQQNKTSSHAVPPLNRINRGNNGKGWRYYPGILFTGFIAYFSYSFIILIILSLIIITQPCVITLEDLKIQIKGKFSTCKNVVKSNSLKS